MFENYNRHDIAAYAGYVTDQKELLECSSGGIATALARKMIQSGGYVAGVSYSSDFYKAQYELARSLDELDRFKGSKYINAEIGTIYSDVRQLLEQGESVLFFGLPCTVAGLKKYLGKEYVNLLTTELICHGPTATKVHYQYVTHLEEKFNSKITDFSVKKKCGKWTPGYLYAEFENGETFCEEFYHTEYGYAFSVMGRPGCYSCNFRGNNRTGDIMIGDFWGADEKDAFWNKNGVSSILVHTEKGDSFLNSVDGISLYNTTFEKIAAKNLNIINPRSVHPDREKFEKLFDSHGLFYAAAHSKGTLSKFKRFIPSSLLPHIKKLYRKLKNR